MIILGNLWPFFSSHHKSSMESKVKVWDSQCKSLILLSVNHSVVDFGACLGTCGQFALHRALITFWQCMLVSTVGQWPQAVEYRAVVKCDTAGWIILCHVLNKRASARVTHTHGSLQASVLGSQQRRVLAVHSSGGAMVWVVCFAKSDPCWAFTEYSGTTFETVFFTSSWQRHGISWSTLFLTNAFAALL